MVKRQFGQRFAQINKTVQFSVMDLTRIHGKELSKILQNKSHLGDPIKISSHFANPDFVLLLFIFSGLWDSDSEPLLKI
jgi:hypothetical protein